MAATRIPRQKAQTTLMVLSSPARCSLLESRTLSIVSAATATPANDAAEIVPPAGDAGQAQRLLHGDEQQQPQFGKTNGSFPAKPRRRRMRSVEIDFGLRTVAPDWYGPPPPQSNLPPRRRSRHR